MSSLRRRDVSGTAARHTYDAYQRKWDKWDNDAFVERECAKVDAEGMYTTNQGLLAFYGPTGLVACAVMAAVAITLIFLKAHGDL
jgi:hypothetical protein